MIGHTTYRGHNIYEERDSGGYFYRVGGHVFPGSSGIVAVALHSIARDEVDFCMDNEPRISSCPVRFATVPAQKEAAR